VAELVVGACIVGIPVGDVRMFEASALAARTLRCRART
jgi:hypothetical protein